MADNVGITPGTGATAAADDIGGVLYQRVKLTTGADGIADGDVSASNPIPAYIRDSATTTSFGPITAANTALFSALEMSNEASVTLQLTGNFDGAIFLQQSNDGTTYWDANGISQSNQTSLSVAVYAPDVVTVHVSARYFRAITSPDFSGSVSGSYVARSVIPPLVRQDVKLAEVADDIRLAMHGLDRNNYLTPARVSTAGGLAPADADSFFGHMRSAGPLIYADTTGFNSISLQIFFGPQGGSGTVTFQASNDGANWNAVLGWPVGGAAAPVTTTTGAGMWLIPAIGRYFRAQITTYTSGSLVAFATLRNQNAFLPQSSPSIAANSTVNVAPIGGTAPVTAGVAGMLAVGGNVAEDASSTSNPIMCGGITRAALPPSTILAGDVIRQTFSVSGQMITKENAPGDLDFYVNATVTTSTQTQLRAAQAGTIRTNVTAVTYQNTNATATTLTIQDGSTTLVTFSVPALMSEPRQLIFPTPLRGTAATALNYTAGTTGANVLLNVIGFSSY